VIHPLAGQGLNIGLRDIADLVNTLQEKETFRAINDRVLLRRYERKRAGDVRAILELTHHLHHLFLRSDTPTQWLRNQGMRLLNQQPFIKRQLIAKAMG
jgi:2-polyprenyl-6-methoxyphenol hydroxylase-like FAD-dependent oxidoreductase